MRLPQRFEEILKKNPKVKIYLRRSKGESGTTADQLVELQSTIKAIEKATGKKIDKGIQGKSLTGEYQGVQFFDKGDIWNEGNGVSGYTVKDRPVFQELLKKLRKGEADLVLAVSMDRYARNYGGFAFEAYDLWNGDAEFRGKPLPKKVFYGLSEQRGLGEPGELGLINEKVLNSLMDWGGLAKQLEIQKGEKKRTGTNIDKGYLLGGKPEWVGKVYKGKTAKQIDYRAVFEGIQAGKGTAALGRIAKKYDRQGQPESSFARTWKPRLKAYGEMGVINEWLDNYEAVSAFILEQSPTQPATAFKSKPASDVLRNTAGYFAYPAGVLIVNNATEQEEFVTFPTPLSVGIERLAVSNPLDLDDWEVERSSTIPKNLNKYQTQPRAARNKGKKK
jgi:hypothetical protein